MQQLAFHLHPDCHRDDTTTLLSFPGFCKRRIPKTNVSTWREAAIANKADADRLMTELAAAARPPDPIRTPGSCAGVPVERQAGMHLRGIRGAPRPEESAEASNPLGRVWAHEQQASSAWLAPSAQMPHAAFEAAHPV